MKNVLMATILCIPLAACYETSSGEMAGQLTYFTKRGIFCKTWEGQIIMGGLVEQNNTNSNGKTITSMVANTSKFTVEKLELVPIIQKAFEEGRQVRLKYTKEAVTFCRADSDDTFVQAVTIR